MNQSGPDPQTYQNVERRPDLVVSTLYIPKQL